MKHLLYRATAFLLSILCVGTAWPARAADHDAQWQRGAVLVRGIGHCGSCHSPRGGGYRQLGGELALSGAIAGGWYASSLRGGREGLGDWTEADIVQYLKTGRTPQAAAFGDMSEVVARHTQHMSQADLGAIAHYLKSLPAAPGARSPSVVADHTFWRLRNGNLDKPGAVLYYEYCYQCHRADGAGFPNIYPSLAGSSAILAGDPLSIIRIILDGGHMPKTATGGLPFAMPGFSQLSDRDVALLATFIRTSWGNSASTVTAATVAAFRRTYALGSASRQAGMPPEFDPPDDIDIPPGPRGQQILLGMRLLRETKRLLPDNVGDQLSCTSCHPGEGKIPFGAPFFGVDAKYPRYNSRAGRVLDLTERINGCFLRSMNGKAVPPDSPEMAAMLAYFQWLSAKVPHGAKIAGVGMHKPVGHLIPNPAHGKVVYEARCAACHGADGEGRKDSRGEYVFPPLWGAQSYNIGAGLARTGPAAAFTKSMMPLAANSHGLLGQAGVLSDQDAVDVGDYFSHQPRADFPPKIHDWPKGGKPKDSRY